MRLRAFVTFLMFPLPTFDLQTHRTTRVVYLKELSFFNTLFEGEKKKVWLCVRSICMISWFCVYIKLFFMCIFTYTPRAKFNCSNLMKISDIHANLFNQLVPSKAIVFILLLYRHRGKFIFITNILNSPAMVNGSVKIPAGCVFF